MIINNII